MLYWSIAVSGQDHKKVTVHYCSPPYFDKPLWVVYFQFAAVGTDLPDAYQVKWFQPTHIPGLPNSINVLHYPQTEYYSRIIWELPVGG